MIKQSMLHGKLDLSCVIPVDKDKPDERAVRFSCDLLMAATICDIVRSEDRKAGDPPSRMYLRRDPTKQWQKMGSTVVFTEKIGDKLRLARKLFPTDEVIPVVPATLKKVSFD